MKMGVPALRFVTGVHVELSGAVPAGYVPTTITASTSHVRRRIVSPIVPVGSVAQTRTVANHVEHVVQTKAAKTANVYSLAVTTTMTATMERTVLSIVASIATVSRQTDLRISPAGAATVGDTVSMVHVLTGHQRAAAGAGRTSLQMVKMRASRRTAVVI